MLSQMQLRDKLAAEEAELKHWQAERDTARRDERSRDNGYFDYCCGIVAFQRSKVELLKEILQ